MMSMTINESVLIQTINRQHASLIYDTCVLTCVLQSDNTDNYQEDQESHQQELQLTPTFSTVNEYEQRRQ